MSTKININEYDNNVFLFVNKARQALIRDGKQIAANNLVKDSFNLKDTDYGKMIKIISQYCEIEG